MIDQDELHRIFAYDKETGLFTRKVIIGKATKIGEVAGYLGNQGYIQIRAHSKTYQAHRLAWVYIYGGEVPAVVDHIDGNKINNAIANLRAADKSKNGANREKHAKSSSQYKGVRSSQNGTRWTAKITVDKSIKHLGQFKCEHEAAHTYNKAAVLYFSEFARLNPVGEPK